MTEEEKKKHLENWQGGKKDAEAFQKGYNKAGEMPEALKSAWNSVANLFVKKAVAKKKDEEY